ncbi:SDR family NAD(P)-dependent oxidoreductase [Sediminibacterium ginsengisoli]|uniref:NAD(P)-dependent dehydrogenase, short-chain alcohol dehydrogenase family n=1 Tax=Sediminibacterium ginsengisoli TaxID=413434 RepID=A0A1T4KWX6_9BACT|nr:SDR family oxidoreductase [Sediminibacterium ginsengisoli]SJZ46870.1 NAD(P)-dependent dehydrogenase, short-chain alcohol dehydrogenase family [Sediminibacterium ginsengisoli]
MFRLDEKTAVVTGGGSGIGKAVAQVFAAQGAFVHIVDLSVANATACLHELQQNGGKGMAHTCDVSDQQQVNVLFAKIGKLDILVNNAGIAHVGNVENTGEADFDRVFNVNVKGVYNCLHAAVPLMKQNGGGAILNLSSIAAVTGIADRFAYSMSKGAVHAMSLSVARDYIKDHIRSNTISPARVHTPFVDGFITKNYPGREAEMFDKLSKSQPIGRMGTVDEVAKLILYLCSDEAAFITGNDYSIDGGFIKLNN